MRTLTNLVCLSGLALGRVQDGSIVDDSPLVVLYYENWAGWIRNFSPSHLENNFLSREYPVRNWVINYAFFAWNPQECSLQNVDTVDLSNGDKGGWTIADWSVDQTAEWETKKPAQGQLIAFMKLRAKYPHIKLMPSIGGWSRSHTYYDCLLTKMDHMVDSVADHVIAWGWDGIDLDWEYPNCDGAPCGCQDEAVCRKETGLSNKAGAGDWDRYKQFVKKVRARFDEMEDKLGRRLYISAALGMNPKIIEGGNKIWSIGAPYEWMCDEDDFDWLNLMTYDFYGPWAAQTGPLAPLYPNPKLEGEQMSIDDSVNRILKKCSKPWKLNMGLATYGKTWQGVPKKGDVPGLWQTSTASTITSGGTFEQGTVSYFDMKKNVLPKCTRTWDDVSKTPTAYCDVFPTATDIPYDTNTGPVPRGQANTFVSYEDGESWKEKMAYARSKGMAGAIIWAASDTGNDQSWSLESTHDLMSGLFEGWYGKKVELNDKPNPFRDATFPVTKWPSFPCPISTPDYIHNNNPSNVARCASAKFDPSQKYLVIPPASEQSAIGKNKLMVHPLGDTPTGSPTNAPNPETTDPETTAYDVTTGAPEPTTAAPDTTAAKPTTAAPHTTAAKPTTAAPHTTAAKPTTAAPDKTTGAPHTTHGSPDSDPVTACQSMVVAPGNADWTKDCQDYCKYVFGTAWCPNGKTGAALAECVVKQKAGECHLA